MLRLRRRACSRLFSDPDDSLPSCAPNEGFLLSKVEDSRALSETLPLFTMAGGFTRSADFLEEELMDLRGETVTHGFIDRSFDDCSEVDRGLMLDIGRSADDWLNARLLSCVGDTTPDDLVRDNSTSPSSLVALRDEQLLCRRFAVGEELAHNVTRATAN